jgi:hypothetical protein
MLLGIYDNSLLKNLEEKESTSPVPRKRVSSSRTIYLSRLMRPKEGPMLLSDFGEARIGPGPHGGDIMPLEYRAPETLLYVGWSYPVDIWSVGLTVGPDFTYYVPPCFPKTNCFLRKGLGPPGAEETLYSAGRGWRPL